MNGHQTEPSPIAVITGASKGLGLVLAKFLAARGYDLIVIHQYIV
jgi:short-subunit dehydrogenase